MADDERSYSQEMIERAIMALRSVNYPEVNQMNFTYRLFMLPVDED